MSLRPLPIIFPAVAFGKSIWDRNVESVFPVLGPERMGPMTLREFEDGGNEWVGGLIVDAKGRCWRVAAVRRGDFAGGWWPERLTLKAHRWYSPEWGLSEEEAIPFSEVLDRACAAMRGDPDSWRDDEAIAGESGEPQDEDEMMERRIAKVRKAKTIKKLAELLDSVG